MARTGKALSVIGHRRLLVATALSLFLAIGMWTNALAQIPEFCYATITGSNESDPPLTLAPGMPGIFV